jgi:hypothetical protein
MTFQTQTAICRLLRDKTLLVRIISDVAEGKNARSRIAVKTEKGEIRIYRRGARFAERSDPHGSSDSRYVLAIPDQRMI